MKRQISTILVTFAFLASLPLSVWTQQTDESKRTKPIGKLIDIGYRLHINCTGKGKRTVVLESGAGDFSFDWGLVQMKAAEFTRVCSYDRAGYAWSEAGPMPRTMPQIAYELHTALGKAGIKPPFVMVGHSLGGLIVRIYAAQYPEEVAGMVLVDSSHEDQLISITDRKTKEAKIVRWRELSANKPIPPIQTALRAPKESVKTQETELQSNSTERKVEAPYDKLPFELQTIRLWAKTQPNYNPARFSEFDFLAEELAGIHDKRSRQRQTLGALPLIVLSRGISEYPGTDEATKARLGADHDRLQSDLVTLSSNSKQITAKKSGHHIHLDEPELVISAIRQVVDSARRKGKLEP